MDLLTNGLRWVLGALIVVSLVALLSGCAAVDAVRVLHPGAGAALDTLDDKAAGATANGLRAWCAAHGYDLARRDRFRRKVNGRIDPLPDGRVPTLVMQDCDGDGEPDKPPEIGS